MNDDRYYSQHGEDFVLWEFFKNEPPGFFIDVGAFDGKHLSNSYFLELKGWDGICVEAQEYYAELCKQNRKALTFNAACTGDPTQVETTFTLFTEGGLGSGVNPEKAIRKNRFAHKQITVPTTTLNTVLADTDITQIDMLSVDVEGTEIDVLSGLDFTKYQPRIMVLEANVKLLDEYVTETLGYHYAGTIRVNRFYARDLADVAILQSIRQECYVKTAHPKIKDHATNKDRRITVQLKQDERR